MQNRTDLIVALRASTSDCRPLVEGPNVKFEAKQELRKLCTLAEKAAALLAVDESQKTPIKKEKKGDDSQG